MRLAKFFEQLIGSNEQFEIVGDVIMGLVCFRLKASDELVNGKIFMLCNHSLIAEPSFANKIEFEWKVSHITLLIPSC